MQTPRTEFAQALRAIATERKLDADVILETIKQAIIAAFKRDAKDRGEDYDLYDFDVELDPGSGEAKVFAWPGADPDDPDSVAKPEERKDVTPPGFGRIAAQTAKQVIHQKIREAEKDAVMGEFSGRVGSLISGMVLRFDGPDVRVDLGRTEGLMPASERVSNERLSPNQRLTFLLKEISETPRGKLLILSRADAEFVQKLFEREVPEMTSGSVEVKGIAREAGLRTKIAVFSSQPGVDPVGSCVGQKGVRVQAITNELGGERVDIVPWSEDEKEFIKAALSPAENLTVKLEKDEKEAKVKAPEDQLSLAIGKDGQNARLAAKLTGWKIKIEESEESKKERSAAAKAEADKEKKQKEEAKKEKPEEAKEEAPESGEEKLEKKEVVDEGQTPAPSDDQKATSDDTTDAKEEDKESSEEKPTEKQEDKKEDKPADESSDEKDNK